MVCPCRADTMSIMWNLAITKNKPLSHYEALAKAIYNLAHIKSYHLVIARMRSIRGNL
ncbi:hypothetical protein [Helicobacter rodentium]|uniref:hypothetical protein n=1 Tax=Helicobacter rodentium TaxID=59617 RepID=UPI00261ED9EE|nr:hypothetical protein [Helicobacter rodentium]